MNDDRRKALRAISAKLEEIKDELEAIKEEEQEALDNLPESMQQSERGEKMEAAIQAMDEVDSNLDNALNSIETATE